jgi:hypothetical protein
VAIISNHRDSNGVPLAVGDTVVLIKDLSVKGAGFTAKRGTFVRGISLVVGDDAHIEGRVNGQRMIILTEFVKKNSVKPKRLGKPAPPPQTPEASRHATNARHWVFWRSGLSGIVI